MDRFDAMRLFTRIVELRSFTQAAHDLGYPKATVTHAIKQLEARLRVRLLQRTTRQVTPTPDGEAYYAHLLKYHTTTDMPAAEIHKFGLEEVARIQDEIKGLVQGK